MDNENIECDVFFSTRSSGDAFTMSSDDGSARTAQQIAAQKRLQQTQAQVDEVVGIMKENVDKVVQRDERLADLDMTASKFFLYFSP